MRASEQRIRKNITDGRMYLFIIIKAILIRICFYLSKTFFLFPLICKSSVAGTGMHLENMFAVLAITNFIDD